MSYRVELRPAAEREYARLPEHTKATVLTVLRRVEADPRHRKVKRIVGHPDLLRARAANHRILFSIDDARRVVSVRRIAPRDKAYKRLSEI